jgi:hypothetical protein
MLASAEHIEEDNARVVVWSPLRTVIGDRRLAKSRDSPATRRDRSASPGDRAGVSSRGPGATPARSAVDAPARVHARVDTSGPLTRRHIRSPSWSAR